MVKINVAILVISLLYVSRVLAVVEFSCSHATDCTSCLSSRSCGWCSQPLRLLNGSWLSQNCFRDVDYGPEVLCFGQISWEPQCLEGWSCNASLSQCVAAPPGQGTSFNHCDGSCGCKAQECKRFRCRGGVDDFFSCVLDETNSSDSQTLEDCSNTCGVSAATPVPRGPGNCTPPCTVPCDPKLENGLCCPNSHCGYDFVWNDFRCHPEGKYCQAAPV
jgi:hypothetical protein